jgi:hypothetical protein
MLKAMPGNLDPEVINKVIIPKIIQQKYPDLSEDELEEVRQYVVLDSVIKNNPIIDLKEIRKGILESEEVKEAIANNTPQDIIQANLIPKIVKLTYPGLTIEESQAFAKLNVRMPQPGDDMGDKRFIRMAGQFVNIDDLHIDLIDQVNPFQKAFEILSKSVTTKTLKVIQECIEATRIQVTEKEALVLWDKIKAFRATSGREPNLNSTDPLERRMAEVLVYLKDQARKRNNVN